MPKLPINKAASQRKISWAYPLSTSRTLPELNRSQDATNMHATLASSLPEWGGEKGGGEKGNEITTSNPVMNMSSEELANVLSAVQNSLAGSERKEEEVVQSSYGNAAAALPQNNFTERLDVQPTQQLPESGGVVTMETNNVQEQSSLLQQSGGGIMQTNEQEEEEDSDMDDLF